MNKTINKFIIKFICKFLFIFKAIANGYIVKYIGNNEYEFKTSIKSYKNYSTKKFIEMCGV